MELFIIILCAFVGFSSLVVLYNICIICKNIKKISYVKNDISANIV